MSLIKFGQGVTELHTKIVAQKLHIINEFDWSTNFQRCSI